eukprot:TRINITY_DN20904_c0_g1_i1.p1 TRINITY_DN20904_c0_g1~~TRINITY_DN20904_c0_g1_i1.p1  ORF type:complete len:346 (-),score=51.47 TRINITY_DN20904_c0_g1_i1:183-1220(-)
MARPQLERALEAPDMDGASACGSESSVSGGSDAGLPPEDPSDREDEASDLNSGASEDDETLPHQRPFVLFWDGPFSNWHRCRFTLGDLEYCCVEQYMMHQKALLFGDSATAAEIMRKTSPKQHKALGRSVRNFKQQTWLRHCDVIVERGCHAKFSQNESLMDMIMATGERLMAEASPSDCVWGIGLREKDARAQNRKQWRGENRLGEVLMRVRTRLREEQGLECQSESDTGQDLAERTSSGCSTRKGADPSHGEKPVEIETLSDASSSDDFLKGNEYLAARGSKSLAQNQSLQDDGGGFPPESGGRVLNKKPSRDQKQKKSTQPSSGRRGKQLNKRGAQAHEDVA